MNICGWCLCQKYSHLQQQCTNNSSSKAGKKTELDQSRVNTPLYSKTLNILYSSYCRGRACRWRAAVWVSPSDALTTRIPHNNKLVNISLLFSLLRHSSHSPCKKKERKEKRSQPKCFSLHVSINAEHIRFWTPWDEVYCEFVNTLDLTKKLFNNSNNKKITSNSNVKNRRHFKTGNMPSHLISLSCKILYFDLVCCKTAN